VRIAVEFVEAWEEMELSWEEVVVAVVDGGAVVGETVLWNIVHVAVVRRVDSVVAVIAAAGE